MSKAKTAPIETLDFNSSRVTEIDLPTLERTVKYQELNKRRPKQHAEVIREIAKMCEANKIVHTLQPIYASQKQAMIVNYEGEADQCPADQFLIKRLVTQIHLEHPEDTDKKISIGIAYNEDGISACFGVNIEVCQNMNIFGSNLIHTHGRDKVSFDDMILNIDNWLKNYEGLRAENYDLIKRMRETEVSHQEVQQIIGDLFSRSVRANMGGENSPLSQVQVADLVRSSEDGIYKLPENQNPSIWDITNWGTHGLKAQNGTDLLTLQATNQRFNNFMLDEYCKN